MSDNKNTIKFSVAHYMGIAENPMVILLDRGVGAFKRQFNSVEELKNCIGEDEPIYFVADKDDNRLNIINDWRRDKFDFEKLEKFLTPC